MHEAAIAHHMSVTHVCRGMMDVNLRSQLALKRGSECVCSLKALPDVAISNAKDSFGDILLSRHLRVATELLGHFQDGTWVFFLG